MSNDLPFEQPLSKQEKAAAIVAAVERNLLAYNTPVIPGHFTKRLMAMMRTWNKK